MKSNITLSTGRVIGHRPYLSNNEPNGATEAYVIGGGNMTDSEWREYCLFIRFRTGEKVKTKPTALTRLVGVITAIHQATAQGHSACASVYCGKHESVKVPLSDLIPA